MRLIVSSMIERWRAVSWWKFAASPHRPISDEGAQLDRFERARLCVGGFSRVEDFLRV